MCVLAHPDDETLGLGPILARSAAEGVETSVVTATRGERGWQGAEADNPGEAALGQLREGELRAACTVLGVKHLHFLDYIDGDLDQADPREAIARIVRYIRRDRPHVVITFGPEGAYGHPDHIAISQFTMSACVAAADASYGSDGLPPHQVAKLYFMADDQVLIDTYISLFGDIVMPVDGVLRRAAPYPDWAVTTRVPTLDYWEVAWRAARCHRSQLPGDDVLDQIPEPVNHLVWGQQRLYRAYSLVNGGRQLETDVFEGLR
jgi:LmbE family N-acetylglucosaminyl deacetylase